MMVAKRTNNLQFFYRGDYVEIVTDNRVYCSMVHCSSKGQYFNHKGKRVYID